LDVDGFTRGQGAALEDEVALGGGDGGGCLGRCLFCCACFEGEVAPGFYDAADGGVGEGGGVVGGVHCFATTSFKFVVGITAFTGRGDDDVATGLKRGIAACFDSAAFDVEAEVGEDEAAG